MTFPLSIITLQCGLIPCGILLFTLGTQMFREDEFAVFRDSKAGAPGMRFRKCPAPWPANVRCVISWTNEKNVFPPLYNGLVSKIGDNGRVSMKILLVLYVALAKEIHQLCW